MDNEMIAISALQKKISQTNYLVSYLNSNDKGPSWDGEIYVYGHPNDKHPKDDLIGKVPVQVKGHKAKKTHEEKIKFQAEVSDLRNYLKDGGTMYFVVYFDENGENECIYYSILLPFDLKRMLKNAGKRKTKTITLIPFPNEKDEIVDLMLTFVNDKNKQKADSEISDIFSYEDLVKKGLSSELTLSYKSIKDRSHDFTGYLFSHGAYVYAKTQLGVLIPVDYIQNFHTSVEVRHGTIKIDGTVYYNSYKIVQKKETINIHVGKSTVYTADLTRNQAKINCKLHGNLSERINDCRFILAMAQHRNVCIDDMNLTEIYPGNFNEQEIVRFEECLKELMLVQKVLSAFNVKTELDMDSMNESDFRNLNRFIYAFEGHEVTLADIGQPFGGYRIGNLKILISTKKNENTGLFKIINFFSSDYRLSLDKGDGTLETLPLFAVLRKNNIDEYCNLDENLLLKQINEIKYTETVSQYIILFLLEVLKAYDMNPVKNIRLLKLAKDILTVLKQNNKFAQPAVIRLNELQIIKRERELNLFEIDELKNIIKTNKTDFEIIIGAYILLDACTEAVLKISELPEEKREMFLEYPICKFMKEK